MPRSRERDTIEGLKRGANEWLLGDPRRAETKLGPVASQGQLERVRYYFDEAAKLGTLESLSCPCGEIDPNGYYVSPSVVSGLPRGTILSREEVFGPLVTVELFDDLDDAISLANDTDFGLSASIWTARSDHAYRLARSIKAGGISIYASIDSARQSGPELGNSRYFEPQKQSGFGIDGGELGFLAYTTAQSVSFFN